MTIDALAIMVRVRIVGLRVPSPGYDSAWPPPSHTL